MTVIHGGSFQRKVENLAPDSANSLAFHPVDEVEGVDDDEDCQHLGAVRQGRACSPLLEMSGAPTKISQEFRGVAARGPTRENEADGRGFSRAVRPREGLIRWSG